MALEPASIYAANTGKIVNATIPAIRSLDYCDNESGRSSRECGNGVLTDDSSEENGIVSTSGGLMNLESADRSHICDSVEQKKIASNCLSCTKSQESDKNRQKHCSHSNQKLVCRNDNDAGKTAIVVKAQSVLSDVKQRDDNQNADTLPAIVPKVIIPSGWPKNNGTVIDGFEKGTCIWGDPSTKDGHPVLCWLNGNRQQSQRSLQHLQNTGRVSTIFRNRRVNLAGRVLGGGGGLSNVTTNDNDEKNERTSTTIEESRKHFGKSNEYRVSRQNKERNEFNPNEGTIDTSSWGSAQNSMKRWESNCRQSIHQPSKASSICNYEVCVSQSSHKGRRDQTFAHCATRLTDFSSNPNRVRQGNMRIAYPQYYQDNKQRNPLDSFMSQNSTDTNNFSTCSSAAYRTTEWRHHSPAQIASNWSVKSPSQYMGSDGETAHYPTNLEVNNSGFNHDSSHRESCAISEHFNSISSDINDQSFRDAARFLLHRISCCSSTACDDDQGEGHKLIQQVQSSYSVVQPPLNNNNESSNYPGSKLDSDLKRAFMQFTCEQGKKAFGPFSSDHSISGEKGPVVRAVNKDDYKSLSNHSHPAGANKLPDQGTIDMASALLASFSGLTGFGSAQSRLNQKQSPPTQHDTLPDSRVSCEFMSRQERPTATILYKKIIKQQFRLSVHAGLLPARLMECRLSLDVLHHVNQMFTLQLRLQHLHVLGRRCLPEYSINMDGTVNCLFSSNAELPSNSPLHPMDATKTTIDAKQFCLMMEILRRKILSLSHSIIQLHHRQADKGGRYQPCLSDSNRADYLSKRGGAFEGLNDTAVRCYQQRNDPYTYVDNRPPSTVASRIPSMFTCNAAVIRNFHAERGGGADTMAAPGLPSSKMYSSSWQNSTLISAADELSSLNKMNVFNAAKDTASSEQECSYEPDMRFLNNCFTSPPLQTRYRWPFAADWETVSSEKKMSQNAFSDRQSESPLCHSETVLPQCSIGDAHLMRQLVTGRACQRANLSVANGCEQDDLYSVSRPYSKQNFPNKGSCVYVLNIRAVNLPFLKSLLRVVGEEPAYKLFEDQAVVFLQYSQVELTKIALRTLKDAGLSASLLLEE